MVCFKQVFKHVLIVATFCLAKLTYEVKHNYVRCKMNKLKATLNMQIVVSMELAMKRQPMRARR